MSGTLANADAQPPAKEPIGPVEDDDSSGSSGASAAAAAIGPEQPGGDDGLSSFANLDRHFDLFKLRIREHVTQMTALKGKAEADPKARAAIKNASKQLGRPFTMDEFIGAQMTIVDGKTFMAIMQVLLVYLSERDELLALLPK